MARLGPNPSEVDPGCGLAEHTRPLSSKRVDEGNGKAVEKTHEKKDLNELGKKKCSPIFFSLCLTIP